MFVASTPIRVRYADTDQMGVVYHSNYIDYFEAGRTEAIRDLGFTYRDMEAMGIIMPVVEVNCKYLRPAKYDDLVTVKTTLTELPKDHKITFIQEIFNEENKLLVTGTVKLYFMEAKTMQRSKMPEQLYNKLKEYFADITSV
ncbi:acyl-CoA thioesterase [Gynurincola endophyticus]|jgi:acyl-CoA thioester hydrolase|uniref:acyl-CoA thioesterase n=1 Tax=Gynurincola endophyticus TaxID=2479004 RepID=UPI000F8ED751|nr:thioesterase family protein [Gynurincola endophyticus]